MKFITYFKYIIISSLILFLNSFALAQESENEIIYYEDGKSPHQTIWSSFGLNVEAVSDEVTAFELIRYSQKSKIDINQGDVYWTGAFNFSGFGFTVGNQSYQTYGYSFLAGAEYRYTASKNIVPFIGLLAGPSFATTTISENDEKVSTETVSDFGGIFRMGTSVFLLETKGKDIGLNLMYDVGLEGGGGALLIGFTFGFHNPSFGKDFVNSFFLLSNFF